MSEPAIRPNAIYVRDVETERIRWLSRGRVAAGKITVLDGDPGLGKSTLLADLAACLTTGRPLPDGTPDRPRGVVLLSAEDGLADTIRPRLEAAGADLGRVLALLTIPDGTPEGRFPELPLDVPALRELVERIDAAMIVIDPLMAYLGSAVNSWRDQDARRALAPLATMADETGAAVVVVRHLNKAQSANALYRGGGSIGIIGAARCGLLLAADPDDAERRILAPTKSNLARPPASLAFRLVPVAGSDVARVQYEGDSSHTASALLAVPGDDDERSERNETADWLRDELAAGPVAAKEILRAARDAGIAERTLRRAKAGLRVRSEREGFGRESVVRWALPASGADSIGCHTSHTWPINNEWQPVHPMAAYADAEPNGHRSPVAIWTCTGCGLPRSGDDRPCPNCGATTGRRIDPGRERRDR